MKNGARSKTSSPKSSASFLSKRTGQVESIFFLLSCLFFRILCSIKSSSQQSSDKVFFFSSYSWMTVDKSPSIIDSQLFFFIISIQFFFFLLSGWEQESRENKRGSTTKTLTDGWHWHSARKGNLIPLKSSCAARVMERPAPRPDPPIYFLLFFFSFRILSRCWTTLLRTLHLHIIGLFNTLE